MKITLTIFGLLSVAASSSARDTALDRSTSDYIHAGRLKHTTFDAEKGT